MRERNVIAREKKGEEERDSLLMHMGEREIQRQRERSKTESKKERSLKGLEKWLDRVRRERLLILIEKRDSERYKELLLIL
jgi:hypothetical protein